MKIKDLLAKSRIGQNMKETNGEPEVNWSKMSASTEWVAMDENGKWYEYWDEPKQNTYGWSIKISCNKDFYLIKPQFYPTFSGPWQESKVRRPQ